MDSQRSEKPADLQQIRHAIWHGDWEEINYLAGAPTAPTESLSEEDLQARAADLVELLAMARRARAEMIGSLGRLRVAGKFLPDRQLFGGNQRLPLRKQGA